MECVNELVQSVSQSVRKNKASAVLPQNDITDDVVHYFKTSAVHLSLFCPTTVHLLIIVQNKKKDIVHLYNSLNKSKRKCHVRIR